MTLGNKIAQCRKSMNITQDTLAQKLGVTNQAVSKWESDQCCPDVLLLPKLADIFGITIDALFGREAQPAKEASQKETSGFDFNNVFGISLEDLDAKANQKKREEPQNPPSPTWPDDNILRVFMYVGQRMVGGGPAKAGYEYHYHDTVDGVVSYAAISCGDVSGDVRAEGNVTCGNVLGHVNAGSDVKCENVEGNVDAGSSVVCGNVEGSVDAGMDVTCGDVGGDVDAGTYVHCGNVDGDVDAGTDVRCGNVGGDVDAGCTVECGSVDGDIDACGPVTIRK